MLDIEPNKLYSISNTIDYLMALVICFNIYVRTIKNNNKHQENFSENFLLFIDIKDLIFVILWLSWLTYLLYLYSKENSFVTFSHKMYFLTKYAYIVVYLAHRVIDTVIEPKKANELVLIFFAMFFVFNWNRQLLGCFQKKSKDDTAYSVDFKSQTSKNTNMNSKSMKISISDDFVASTKNA